MEAHLKQLKNKHAAQLQDMQSLLDRQCDQIDMLLAEQKSLKSQYMQAKHATDAVTGQLDSVRQKSVVIKQEAEADRQEKIQLQATLQALEQAAHNSSQTAAVAADRDSNLHQQVSMLKKQLADNSRQDDLKSLHDQLELAQQEIVSLKAQAESGDRVYYA